MPYDTAYSIPTTNPKRFPEQTKKLKAIPAADIIIL